MLGELEDDERTQFVILLNLLALVLGVFAAHIGFLLSTGRNILAISVAIAPYFIGNSIGATPQSFRYGTGRIAFVMQDVALAPFDIR